MLRSAVLMTSQVKNICSDEITGNNRCYEEVTANDSSSDNVTAVLLTNEWQID